MLIVLTTAPGTTPLETMLDKEPVTQVALLQLIIKSAVTVNVSAGGCRLDEEGAIGPTLDIRVIEGIDVDRHATAMSRHMTAASYAAITEATGIVSAHRTLIVGMVLVNKNHTPYGVTGLVELAEDGKQVVGNTAVAHHLA